MPAHSLTAFIARFGRRRENCDNAAETRLGMMSGRVSNHLQKIPWLRYDSGHETTVRPVAFLRADAA